MNNNINLDSQYKILGIENIMEMLPHRYPFLLIDKIINVDDKSIQGIKNVTINENFFAGHFPNRPIMPGVLIVEALAQVAGIILLHADLLKNKNHYYYLAALNDVKFKKPVVPGDVLHLHAKLIKNFNKISKYETRAIVDENLVCMANITIAKES